MIRIWLKTDRLPKKYLKRFSKIPDIMARVPKSLPWQMYSFLDIPSFGSKVEYYENKDVVVIAGWWKNRL